jgi:2TM domain
MLHDISDDATTDGGPVASASREQLARQQAIKQIRRRRRFWISTAFSTVGMILLAAIWAITEYHNAGGWPTSGFSQSSGIHDVWNCWIIYPLIAWVLVTVAHGWSVYGNRPISEREIQREIERQDSPPR